MSGIELTNSVYGTVISSLLKVKDENDVYYTVFPINTLHEVYYDMEKQITLEKFLEDKHLPQKIHHIKSLDEINNAILTKENVFIGDLIAVGGTHISDADYLYLVLNNTNFEDKTSLLELSIGTITVKNFTLTASNWIKSPYDTACDCIEHGCTCEECASVNSSCNFDGYVYIISDDVNLPIREFIDIEIDFASMSDMEKASNYEIQAYCDHGTDDGKGNSFIRLYASYKPEDDIDIIINFINIRY